MIFPFLTACLFGIGLSLLAFIPVSQIWFSLPFTAINVLLVTLLYGGYFIANGRLPTLLKKFKKRHLAPSIITGTLGTFVSVILVQYGWSLPWIDGSGVNSSFNIVAQQLDLIAALLLGVILFRNRFTLPDGIASALVLCGVIALGLVSGSSQYVFNVSIIYIGISGMLFGAANIYSGVLGHDFDFKEVILIRFVFAAPLAILALIASALCHPEAIAHSYLSTFISTLAQGGMDQSHSTLISMESGLIFWGLYLLLNYLLGYLFLVMAFSVTHRSAFNSIVMQFGPVITALSSLLIYYGFGRYGFAELLQGIKIQLIPTLMVMSGVIYHTLYTSRQEASQKENRPLEHGSEQVVT
ncbi:hypothetical protein [Dongshaea marina]|uniref:hypothetical protein n=1 Tax=Dongshaea marina TaxID=2047966 RepID=UPI000D3E28C8|nr:hypothetical protein [Dongshaea marina]